MERERITLPGINSWIIGKRCKHSANSICDLCQVEKERMEIIKMEWNNRKLAAENERVRLENEGIKLENENRKLKAEDGTTYLTQQEQLPK